MDQEELWQQIAKQLGIQPQTVRQQLQNGTLQETLLQNKNAVPAEAQRVLQNPEELQKLLSSPQARMLMQLLSQQKK